MNLTSKIDASPFLALPTEVRLRVYPFLFEESVVYVRGWIKGKDETGW